MLALFLVCFCFVLCFVFCVFCVLCFCLVSCFGFSLWKKRLFSLQLWCFWVMLVKRVVWFLCFMFLFFACFSCAVCFHFKVFICISLFLCCFFWHKTKWSSCLHLVVLLPFLFVLQFCFEFCLFFIPLKKRPPKKPDTAKPPPKKNAEKKTTKIQLAQLCSQLVFLIFLGRP